MLLELAVRDLGVIADLRLDFGAGMCALTGETGAGKTMIIEALALLLGGKTDPTRVRPGADASVVEGRFAVPGEAGADDDEIVLRRVVPAEGRSRCYVNGEMATAAGLAEIGGRLVEICGQHSHQRLQSTRAQRDALDRFGSINLAALVVAQSRRRELEAQLAALGGDERARAREIDLLRFQVDELDAAAIEKLFAHAEAIEGRKLPLDAEARAALARMADGDGRAALTLAEEVWRSARKDEIFDAAQLQDILQRRAPIYDKSADGHYNLISALHKSVRGSDPDASLYWLCRMLDGGAEPLYLGRRLVRMAVEDVGLADPRALEIALNACATYERLGSPEGELALAQAAVFLACAAKSNAVYKAYNAARKFVSNDGSRPVPIHLRNAPTRLMKELGYGKAYRYAHDEPDGYAAGENYLPEGMAKPNWYEPVGRGLEAKIAEKLERLRELDKLALARAGKADISAGQDGSR